MYNFTNEFRKAVETRFKSEFGILYPSMPVQWDNFTFEQPKNAPWVSFTFRQNPAKQRSIGRKFIVRTTGFIQIDVNIPENSGLNSGRDIAETAAEIFAHKKFKGTTITISCGEAHVDAAPTSGAFRRIMARVFFYYDGERLREGVQQIV